MTKAEIKALLRVMSDAGSKIMLDKKTRNLTVAKFQQLYDIEDRARAASAGNAASSPARSSMR